MQLSNILSHHSPIAAASVHLTCFIEESFVTMALWTIVDDKPKVIAVGTPKEWTETANFYDAVDLGIEEFHQNEGLTRQVLFSVPESWVANNQITAQHKEILKTLCQKLDLKPLGFVVSIEALFHYIFEYKTSSILALFFQFDSQEFRVFVTEHGEITTREVVGRSENLADDIKEALGRIPTRPLPAQLYFFSFQLTLDQIETEKQAFFRHEWEKENIFRHLPSIELITRSTMVEAACLIGGKEVTGAAQIDESEAKALLNETHKPEAAAIVPAEITQEQKEEISEEIDEMENLTADDNLTEPDNQPNVYSFGVKMPPKVISAPSVDVVDPNNVEKTTHASNFRDPLDYAIEVDPQMPARPGSKQWQRKLAAIGGFLTPMRFFPGIKRRLAMTSVGGSKKKMTMVFVGLLLLAALGGAYAYLITQTQVEVVVHLSTKSVSTDTTIILDPKVSETSATERILKVGTLTKEVSDKEETSTTGTKIIGEKAKGKLMILNKTTNSKTFAAGTEIREGTKIFLTDSEVTVASASTKESGDSQTIDFGKTEVAVTAKEIGADYNLAKGTEFTVANFGKDTYSARAENALADGTSREIQAVSQDDMTRLRASLKKSLLAKAEEELTKEAKDGTFIISAGQAKIISEEFNAKVGEEVNNLSLEMTAEATAYSYQSSDLTPIGREQLLSMVPNEGVLLDETISILSRPSEEASGSAKLQLDATLSADYVPPTDTPLWISQIKGRTVEQAEQTLTDKEEIDSIELKFSPSIAKIILGRLPNDASRISVSKKIKE